MLEHSNFTLWIKREAKYAIYKGEKKEIKDVYLTPAERFNDIDVIIAFTDGNGSKNFEDLDYQDLSNRYNKKVRLKRR